MAHAALQDLHGDPGATKGWGALCVLPAVTCPDMTCVGHPSSRSQENGIAQELQMLSK